MQNLPIFKSLGFQIADLNPGFLAPRIKEMHGISFAKRTLCYQIWEKEPYLAMPADQSIILKLKTARQRETF